MSKNPYNTITWQHLEREDREQKLSEAAATFFEAGMRLTGKSDDAAVVNTSPDHKVHVDKPDVAASVDAAGTSVNVSLNGYRQFSSLPASCDIEFDDPQGDGSYIVETRRYANGTYGTYAYPKDSYSHRGDWISSQGSRDEQMAVLLILELASKALEQVAPYAGPESTL